MYSIDVLRNVAIKVTRVDRAPPRPLFLRSNDLRPGLEPRTDAKKAPSARGSPVKGSVRAEGARRGLRAAAAVRLSF